MLLFSCGLPGGALRTRNWSTKGNSISETKLELYARRKYSLLQPFLPKTRWLALKVVQKLRSKIKIAELNKYLYTHCTKERTLEQCYRKVSHFQIIFFNRNCPGSHEDVQYLIFLPNHTGGYLINET